MRAFLGARAHGCRCWSGSYAKTPAGWGGRFLFRLPIWLTSGGGGRRASRAGELGDDGSVRSWSCLDVPAGDDVQLIGSTALGRVLAAVPATGTLVIAGDGPILAKVRRRIAELNLGEAVDVLGNVPRSGVAALMHESAVYCLPSFGEPYGMSAIEAMAAGLPLVVTDRGGLAEVADAQGALYVQPGDVEALTGALLAVLASPERARSMGDYNMRRVREVFAWSTVVASLEAAYAGVSRGQKARR